MAPDVTVRLAGFDDLGNRKTIEMPRTQHELEMREFPQAEWDFIMQTVDLIKLKSGSVFGRVEFEFMPARSPIFGTHDLVLQFTMRVVDRNSAEGKEIDVMTHKVIDKFILMTCVHQGRAKLLEYLVWQVRNGLKEIVTHEVDEEIHVDGVRIFDPHARG